MRREPLFALTMLVAVVGVAVDSLHAQSGGPPATENESTAVATADDEQAKALAVKLQAQLSGTKEELAAIAHTMGSQLIARLKHDLEIARIDQRRRRIEQTRVQVVDVAEQSAGERRELLSEMEAELQKTREQFADDAAICESQQVAVIQAFRGKLKSLKDDEERGRGRAEEMNDVLADLRRQSVERERARWLTERMPALSPSEIQPHDYSWIHPKPQPASDLPAEEAPSESLQQAMDSLQDFRDS